MSDVVFFKGEKAQLEPSPINPAWVIEGKPVARNFLVSKSLDGSGFTYLWDCTAGVFNWYYDIDETVYIIEGSVTVRDDNGKEWHLTAGDHVLFRAGSHAVWRVENYVRKVAFFRQPVPASLSLLVRAVRKVSRMLNLGPANADTGFTAQSSSGGTE
jgi:uncharacterized cupin superfamily protein